MGYYSVFFLSYFGDQPFIKKLEVRGICEFMEKLTYLVIKEVPLCFTKGFTEFATKGNVMDLAASS